MDFPFNDLLDHICCIVEEQMDIGRDFEEALGYAFNVLPISEIKKTEMDTLRLTHMTKYRIKKILSYLPEAVFLLISLSWIIDLIKGYNNWITWFTFSATILLTIMIIFRLKYLAIINSYICGMCSLLCLFAVFPSFENYLNSIAFSIWEWIAAVVMLIGLIILAFLMPWKYFEIEE